MAETNGNQIIRHEDLAVINNAESRDVFVAYPYSLENLHDYRNTYLRLKSNFHANFIFADNEHTGEMLLQKIAAQIKASRMALFDVSMWNANVILELGIAMGLDIPTYIFFNPAYTPHQSIPSDIDGIDRKVYSNIDELSIAVSAVLERHLAVDDDYIIKNAYIQIKHKKLEDQDMTKYREIYANIGSVPRELIRLLGNEKDSWLPLIEQQEFEELARQFYLRFLAREPENHSVVQGRAFQLESEWEKHGEISRNVDDYVNSQEYSNRFGDRIVPYNE
ncbi:MAG: phycobilisome rod-core linker polypeptide [Candidatus Lernaella stagnicola]|nr:phycobilisome rod-core linker polypeptide [Candidatus Lernaella stagnicola]